MTLARNQDECWSVECDECGHGQELAGQLFVEIVTELQESDWLSSRVGLNWEHFCNYCQVEDEE